VTGQDQTQQTRMLTATSAQGKVTEKNWRSVWTAAACCWVPVLITAGC